MPANTPNGLPYPLPTEPVAEGALAIRNLAEAVNTPQAWQEITAFLNNWVNLGGTKDTAGYYKDRSGIVRLKGAVGSGVNGQALFLLPTGYRPAKDVRWTTIAFDGAAERVGRIDIAASNGQIVVTVPGASTVVEAWLTGSFRAA